MSNTPPVRPEDGTGGALLRSDESDHTQIPLPAGADATSIGSTRQASLWSDAWRQLRRNPVFIVASTLLVVLSVMAVFPQLFTRTDPLMCNLTNSRGGPGTNGA